MFAWEQDSGRVEVPPKSCPHAFFNLIKPRGSISPQSLQTALKQVGSGRQCAAENNISN